MSNEQVSSNPARLTLEVSPEQAGQLEVLFEMAKALAGPGRLAIVGALVGHLKETLTLDELVERTGIAAGRMERDLRQLEEAGLIRVEEWQADKPGREPLPWRMAFNPDYLRLMPQLITTLHQLTGQLRPSEEKAPMDERAKTLGRFLKAGRIIGWPVQFKRQVYLVEEVAKIFEPGIRYSERQVDTLLKEVYDDHCMLRHSLVDLKFLERANGIYWKVGSELSPV